MGAIVGANYIISLIQMVSPFQTFFLLPTIHYILEKTSQAGRCLAARTPRERSQKKLTCAQGTKVVVFSLRNDDYFMGTYYIEELLGNGQHEVTFFHLFLYFSYSYCRKITTLKDVAKTIDSKIVKIIQKVTNTLKKGKKINRQQTTKCK